jgi:hypothetical protein
MSMDSVVNPPITLETVQLGSVYDVLDSKGRWCEGEIIKVDKQNARVYVKYVYWDSDYDEWVDGISHRLAPKHFHTYIEGGVLKEGQRVEAQDERGEWLQAFVIEEQPEKVKVHFKGYAPKYDRWIRRDEAAGNVRQFGRMRFQFRYLQESRRRDFLNNSNTKWSVPGMESALVNANNRRSTAASSSSTSSSAVYEESKANNEGRICCTEDDARTRKIVDMSDKFHQYVLALNQQALHVVRVAGDGNCLFRSVAHQIYGDESLHDIVREKCMEYMESEADFFSQFVVGGKEMFSLYLEAKRRSGCWGDDPEIEALCELYDRPAEIWAYDPSRGATKLRTFHEIAGGVAAPGLFNGMADMASETTGATSSALLPGSTRITSRGESGRRPPRRVRGNGRSNNQTEVDHDGEGDTDDMDIVDPADDDDQHHSPVSSSDRQMVHLLQQGHVGNGNNSNSNIRSVTGAPFVPTIRLSYYGGGHYDSIVADDHHLGLLRGKPGEWENARIRQSHRMVMEATAASSSASSTAAVQRNPLVPMNQGISSLMTPSSLALTQRHRSQQAEQWQAKALADEEAEATRASQETARQREQTDLETTLLISLQQHQQEQAKQSIREAEEHEQAVLALVVAESKQAYLRESQQQDLEDEEEDALVALAIAQSKESYPTPYVASEKKQSASQSSSKDLNTTAKELKNLTADEALNLVIEQSLQEYIAETKQGSSPLRSTATIPEAKRFDFNAAVSDARTHGMVSDQEEEDALLQQALAESLRSSSNNSNSNNNNNNNNNNPFPPNHSNNNHSSIMNPVPAYLAGDDYGFEMHADDEDDPDLLLAIQESLRR